MTYAYDDFWETIHSLREIAGLLGDVAPGTQGSRSANHIRLNGLHVTAFAALEDFVRRRAHEVISWLGSQDIKFSDLPEKLQRLVLQGTVEGICFSLSRTDKDDRVTLLQLQGLLLGSTGENNEKFVPSEFFFGRSASNLSKDNLRELLDALGLGEKLACLTEVASLIEMPHLGAIEGVFTRLSRNRHSAAHAFGSDYKYSDFKSDMSSALPVLAFSFDTCISQCALSIRKTVITEKIPYKSFSINSSNIRVLEFNPNESCWQEFRNSRPITNHTKGRIKKRIEDFKNGSIAKEDTILIKGEQGAIDGWIQPLRN